MRQLNKTQMCGYGLPLCLLGRTVYVVVSVLNYVALFCCVVCRVVRVVVCFVGGASAVLFHSLFVVAKVQPCVCVQTNQKLPLLPWARPPLP